jgi:hypothetical protein
MMAARAEAQGVPAKTVMSHRVWDIFAVDLLENGVPA